MIESSIFITLCIILFAGFIFWVIFINARSNAVEDFALAFYNFGGEHSKILLSALESDGVDRSKISAEEEVICEQLEGVGLFTECPGKWIVSADRRPILDKIIRNKMQANVCE